MDVKIRKPDFVIEAEKKIKVIWDLLKTTDAVRFSLKVTLYRQDSRKPLMITMEGTRADNGEWNVRTPPRKLLNPLGSSAELREKLNAVEASVENYISKNSLEERWQDWVDALEEVMKSGHSAEDLEFRSEIPIRALGKYGYDAHFFAPVMAMAHVMEGTGALARNDLEQASRSAERGLYWSHVDMFIANPSGRFIERAGTGGSATGLRREPVKEKVTELLKSLAPTEGWESTKDAIKAVVIELNDSYFRLVESCHLKVENLPRTVEDWIKQSRKGSSITSSPSTRSDASLHACPRPSAEGFFYAQIFLLVAVETRRSCSLPCVHRSVQCRAAQIDAGRSGVVHGG